MIINLYVKHLTNNFSQKNKKLEVFKNIFSDFALTKDTKI